MIFSILVSVQICFGQQKALTETGDEVILYDDGTWKYTNQAETTFIDTNKVEFKKNDNSTFLLKSKKFNIGVWINPKKWKFIKHF